MLRRSALALAALSVIGVTEASAAPDQRLALVIGNATYAEAPLKNPANDARAIAASLRARGFEVMVRENATKQQMEAAVADFGEKLTEGSTGLFFYAGHGMQVNGRNYLIPTNARITSEQRVRVEAVDVDLVLEQMQAARSKVSLVILDACRNNPFERRFRSMGGGLAQINAPEGTLIAYATAPGKVAADGEGANGLYTQELLRALNEPGLKVEDVFKQVRINVSRVSSGGQVPWEASSLTGDFYFVPPVAAAAAPSIEAIFWNVIKDSTSYVEVQAFLERFPRGEFAGHARQRLATLAPPKPAAAPSMEAMYWDIIKDSRNAAELQAYIDRFPNGEFAGQARLRIAALPRPAPAPAPPPQAPAPVAAVPATPAQSSRPPAAPPAAAPLPSAMPQQVAAVALPANNVFEGRYETRFRRGIGDVTGAIQIEGSRVSGFVQTQGNPEVCRIAGAIDGMGAVQQLLLLCPQSNGSDMTISGRFIIGDDGRVVRAETKGRSLSDSSDIPIAWTRVGRAPSPEEVAAQSAGGKYDGTYTSMIRGARSSFEATLMIQGSKVSGFANLGMAGLCRMSGTVNADGTIPHIASTGCTREATFSGRMVTDPSTGGMVIETTAGWSNATQVWKKN